eukprot:5315211-Heterocapsa_arctica.AAC.1
MPGPIKLGRQERQVCKQPRQDGGDRQVRQGRPRRHAGGFGKAVVVGLCCGWLGSGLEATATMEWQASKRPGVGKSADYRISG